jgi:hypothetical protein
MKPRRLAPAIALAAIGLAGLGMPAAAWAMRCGTRLVVEGDLAIDVRAKCGEPTDITRKSVLKPAIIWLNGRPVQVGNGLLDVSVEIWTYDLGPLKLMRQLRIEDGKVVQIDTLGYGHR